MAAEPWNRLHIPRPAIQSLVTVPLGVDTEKYIKDVVERCLAVQLSLRSKALDAEKAALHSILYVYHHRLCYHKPYLALKQVEQCVKRVNAMDLDGSIQEMLELCPKYIRKKTQHCAVPSQPIMELVSVKILGACKLILRLMDGCCKAFHLFLQHLNLEEFIVLNVVLLGLLSRLWVMYRGILKKLISLYGAQFSLQQEVSGFQNMPYIKDFSFPAKIEDFLGPVLADIVKKKLPQISSKKGAPQLLNKMFSSNGLINKDIKVKRAKIVDLLETRKNVVDLGRPIQIPRFDRGNFGTFNVKKLCQPLKASAPQVCRSKRKSTVSTRQTIPSCHRLKSKCAAQLVPKVQRAESFRELSEQLQDAVKWCKHRKLISEVFFLRKKYLKIKRLKYIEALGNSLKRKLECLKKSICSGLQQGTQKAHHRKPHAKIQSFLQTGWGHKVTRSRENRSKNYQNRRIIYSGLSKPKAEGIDLKKSAISLHEDLGDQEGFSAVINIVTPWEERSPEMLVSSNFSAIMAANISTDADDIDDIFSSIGL